MIAPTKRSDTVMKTPKQSPGHPVIAIRTRRLTPRRLHSAETIAAFRGSDCPVLHTSPTRSREQRSDFAQPVLHHDDVVGAHAIVLFDGEDTAVGADIVEPDPAVLREQWLVERGTRHVRAQLRMRRDCADHERRTVDEIQPIGVLRPPGLRAAIYRYPNLAGRHRIGLHVDLKAARLVGAA